MLLLMIWIWEGSAYRQHIKYQTMPHQTRQHRGMLACTLLQRYFKDTRSAFAVLHPGLQSFMV